jgi:diaminopimelate decarboxylase
MDYFNYENHQLYAEQVLVEDIANQYGTPCYIYSAATLRRHFNAFADGLANVNHLVCYAVKANSNIAILQLLARMGAGFDIVSQGELERALAAGADPQKIVFSGVGKKRQEIQRALEVGILSINVESLPELYRIIDIAEALGKPAPISIRINPDVDAHTHPYISTGLKENKFGVDIKTAIEMYQLATASPALEVHGIDCHIGSQLTSLEPFLEALKHVINTIKHLKDLGIPIKHLNLGGGIGVPYTDEIPPHPTEYGAAVAEQIKDLDITLIVEPGRAIAANAGILVTTVEYIKKHHDKNFVIVDTAMNDLLRPAMYQAYHQIIPVNCVAERKPITVDVVGPICETGDFIGKQRELAVEAGELLAIRSAGAYSFSMSSNYNSRGRAPEILVDGANSYCIRDRESLTSLYQCEHLL